MNCLKRSMRCVRSWQIARTDGQIQPIQRWRVAGEAPMDELSTDGSDGAFLALPIPRSFHRSSPTTRRPMKWCTNLLRPRRTVSNRRKRENLDQHRQDQSGRRAGRHLTRPARPGAAHAPQSRGSRRCRGSRQATSPETPSRLDRSARSGRGATDLGRTQETSRLKPNPPGRHRARTVRMLGHSPAVRRLER